MKKKFITGGFGLSLVILSLIACNKELSDKTDRPLKAGVSSSCDCGNVVFSDSTISGVINSNLHLTNNKVYKLRGLVFVTNGATLSIEGGTTIRGMKATGTNVNNDNSGTLQYVRI